MTAFTAITSTISPADAAQRAWDAVVVGAGPAGSLAARELARSGAAVLLVDKAIFPRAKVCGCCLNGAALAALECVGLGELPGRLGGIPLSRWRLHTRSAQAECRLPGGIALSRAALDAALVEAAMEAGSSFLSDTKATLDAELSSTGRAVLLASGTERTTVSAQVVLVADGLAGNSLARLDELASQVEAVSRLGAGAVFTTVGDDYAPGCIYMASGQGGYVGLVRLEDGRLDVAAALDRVAMREAGGPGALAARILLEVHLPVPEGMLAAAWRGTPPLTRRRPVAAERLFVLGDAAGYLEPFTGEGMAWALASAVAVAPLALAGARAWRPNCSGVDATAARNRGRKQRVCVLAGAILRRPLLAGVVSRMLAIAPWLASPLIGAINRPAAQGRAKNNLSI